MTQFHIQPYKSSNKLDFKTCLCLDISKRCSDKPKTSMLFSLPLGRGATKCHRREWRGKSSNVQHKLFKYQEETAVIKYTQQSELDMWTGINTMD
jgi:hypothetical protein